VCRVYVRVYALNYGSKHVGFLRFLAERVGFEPLCGQPLQWLSSLTRACPISEIGVRLTTLTANCSMRRAPP
jgi:hypothetical protein